MESKYGSGYDAGSDSDMSLDEPATSCSDHDDDSDEDIEGAIEKYDVSKSDLKHHIREGACNPVVNPKNKRKFVEAKPTTEIYNECYQSDSSLSEEDSNVSLDEEESGSYHDYSSEVKKKDPELNQKHEIENVEAEPVTEISNECDQNDSNVSDEEDIRNTVGNIPMNWYDEYKHIGYDWDGKQIIKPDHGDQIDYFLKRMENPDFWRTVRDQQTGQDVVLDNRDIDLIKRFEDHKIPDLAYDEYAPWIEWFSSEVMDMPVRKFPEQKRSFVPSKDEMRRVSKYVHALKMGWMKKRKELRKERLKKNERFPKFYMLWGSDNAADEMRRIENHIPAPKRPLPDHSESYNPPEEYLFNEKEMKKWNRDHKSLGNKKLHFIPQKFKSLREVPSYKRFIRERFLRCLDLYMCPRSVKMKLTIEPEDLVPHLPSPKDLQPFPTDVALIYTGHSDAVTFLSVDPSGQYLASASKDSSVKFWEISTGRCLKTVKFNDSCSCIAWNPNQSICLVAVVSNRSVMLINPGLSDYVVVSKTDSVFENPLSETEIEIPDVKSAVNWKLAEGVEWLNDIRIIIEHFRELKQVTWHGKGDYFATVLSGGENRSVVVHQLSKRKSQFPFSKSKGLVQTVLFHPIRPLFFVATQRSIRVYDLVKQEMVKKLYSNSQWISCMAVHPGGDNLLVGTFDRKVLWFDLDLSTLPYKSLALHNAAVRSVAFHSRYPLFATVSDDRSVIISHGMVYNDLLKNALIVPLKRLSHHECVDDYSVMDVMFHPTKPWVFTCGADGNILLYS